MGSSWWMVGCRDFDQVLRPVLQELLLLIKTALDKLEGARKKGKLNALEELKRGSKVFLCLTDL